MWAVPNGQFRFSATLILARALSDTGRDGDALLLLKAERGSEAHPPKMGGTLDAWIEMLGDRP